jgi:TRAP-type C4-dicarboxylate transport system substrate-binding protein
MALFRLCALVSLAGLCLAWPARAQTTLTLSSWAPPSHPLTSVVLQGFADEVEKASGGRLKFRMLVQHPVAGPATFDAVRDGAMDISVAVTSWTPARHILPRIAEFPGTGETAEVNSVAYSRLHFRHLQQAGEYQGVHLIGVFTHGPGHVFTTKRAIAGVSDFQGMRIRTGGGTSEAMVHVLGALPLVTAVPQEAHDLLSSGAADGTFFPQDSFVSFKLDKLVKYATLFPGGLFNYSFAIFMNEGKWNALSGEDRDLINRFGGEYLARRAGKAWDSADRLGNDAMHRADMRIDSASAVLVKETRLKARPMIEAWIEDVKAQRHLDGATLLREFADELKRAAEGP